MSMAPVDVYAHTLRPGEKFIWRKDRHRWYLWRSEQALAVEQLEKIREAWDRMRSQDREGVEYIDAWLELERLITEPLG